MVTARDTASKANELRTTFKDYLIDFATTIVRTRITETKDSMNRVISTSSANTTYKADIQWITKQDLLHLNLGDVKIGDGMMFVPYDADIEIDDEITYNSVQWRVTSQIEGEQVNGNVIYQGFIITKNSQS